MHILVLRYFGIIVKCQIKPFWSFFSNYFDLHKLLLMFTLCHIFRANAENISQHLTPKSLLEMRETVFPLLSRFTYGKHAGMWEA